MEERKELRCMRCGDPLRFDLDGWPNNNGDYCCQDYTGHDEYGRFAASHEPVIARVKEEDEQYGIHHDDDPCDICKRESKVVLITPEELREIADDLEREGPNFVRVLETQAHTFIDVMNVRKVEGK